MNKQTSTIMGQKKTHIIIEILVFVVVVSAAIFFVVLPHYKNVQNEKTAEAANPKTVDGQIVLLQQQIKAQPNTIANYISLSQAYLQKVRDTADISYYQKINDLMVTAAKIDPKNADVPATRASVEIGRHQFTEGKQYAEAAIALNPNNHLYYGLVGDADIELGQYEDAVNNFQKMTDIRPDYSAYIRIAYIRELYGDIKGAKNALGLAIEAGSSFNENIAFAYVELGKLDMRDDLEKATADYQTALQILPSYPPALEGLGKVAFFLKDNTKALEFLNQAFTARPIAQYAGDIGDVYFIEGDTAKANQYYTLGEISFKTSDKGGVDNDLEESLFLSDHNMDLAQALTQAKAAYAVRPSINGANALAWAYYRNGDDADAAKLIPEMVTLGQNDPLQVYHAAVIALANGDKANGKKYLQKTLSLSQNFAILDAAAAKALLKKL